MSKVVVLLVLFAFIAISTPSFADQAACLYKSEAEAAVCLLRGAKKLRFFCAPCNDSMPITRTVESLRAVPINRDDLWEVQVNGEEIDLAYTYFLKEGQWKNVAIETGIEVEMVPEYIR